VEDKDYRELTRCWGAFIIAVCYEKYISPETAFSLYDTGKPDVMYADENKRDEVIRLRSNGATLKQIGDIYNISVSGVSKYIKRHAPELINSKEE